MPVWGWTEEGVPGEEACSAPVLAWMQGQAPGWPSGLETGRSKAAAWR